MTYTHTSLVLVATLLCLGWSEQAGAYSPPEDVLHSAPVLQYRSPASRRAEAAAQAQANQERIDRLYEAWYGTDTEDIPVDEPTHGAADDPEEDSTTIRLELNAADLRLIERILSARDARNQQDDTLHSGAPLDEMPVWTGGKPLTPSGPAGPLTAVAILGAVGWTLWRAKKAA
jgi:hypothetical protein